MNVLRRTTGSNSSDSAAPRRQPKGVPAGGQFATGTHDEATGELVDPAPLPPVNLNDAEQIDSALSTVSLCWVGGISDVDAVVRAIQQDYEQRGFAPPDKLKLLFHPDLGNVIQNRWNANEPDEWDGEWGPPGAPSWKGANFSPAESTQWSEAGMYEPFIARQCIKAGMTLDDARRYYDVETRYDPYDPYDPGGPSITVGRAVSSGLISVETGMEYVAAEKEREATEAAVEPDVGF